ncbi:MAG: hypothetical protein GXO70_09155 [Acidobacteria bacterium]|nr:hypothetical protein [Acidobacteriota bacterium]
MKQLVVFLMFCMMVPAFGAYKLVLKNGAVLELAKKPDLSGKQVTAETVKGKKIIFSVRFVDRNATEVANRKKLIPKKQGIPVRQVVSDTVRKVIPVIPVPKTGKHKVPLVITNETVKKGVMGVVADEEMESKAAEDLRQEKDRTANAFTVEGNNESPGPVDDKGRSEEFWRGKFQENMELQAGVLKDLKKMQFKMNAMTSRRIQTDSELEKRSLTGKIQELQKLIDKAKLSLQKIKEDKEKLLEEARSSGALPGWYRDYED